MGKKCQNLYTKKSYFTETTYQINGRFKLTKLRNQISLFVQYILIPKNSLRILALLKSYCALLCLCLNNNHVFSTNDTNCRYHRNRNMLYTIYIRIANRLHFFDIQCYCCLSRYIFFTNTVPIEAYSNIEKNNLPTLICNCLVSIIYND